MREIFSKYYTEMYSSYKTSAREEPARASDEKFVLIPHEKVMKFTSLIAKPVIDNRGFEVGKVKDIAITVLKNELPIVTGLITTNRFISWNDVGGFGDTFKLSKRSFELSYPQISNDVIFVGKRILDEQLVNENKNIGRVDDVKFMYDNKENKLKIIGICSGVLPRLGIKGFYETIPWQCVSEIRNERPTALVLDLKSRRLSPIPSDHDKGVVSSRFVGYN